MERPEISGQQVPLFDTKRYIDHRFVFPNVIEVKFPQAENSGHDDAFDNIKCDNELADTVRAKIFDLPRRIPPPDLVA